MRKLALALRMILLLPPVWLALMAVTLAVVTNDPMLDVLAYAAERLFGLPVR
jgi:hypothetical protein